MDANHAKYYHLQDFFTYALSSFVLFSHIKSVIKSTFFNKCTSPNLPTKNPLLMEIFLCYIYFIYFSSNLRRESGLQTSESQEIPTGEENEPTLSQKASSFIETSAVRYNGPALPTPFRMQGRPGCS